MAPKCIMRHEQRFQCLVNCRFYRKCITKNGKQCKHLGGHRIPVFRSLRKEDFEEFRLVGEDYIR